MTQSITLEFPATLADITGLEEQGGLSRLIDRTVTGNLRFLNSGIGLSQSLPSSDKPSFQSIGRYAHNYFRQGDRFTYTQLRLPPDTFDQQPHCHPGGEIAIVRRGMYFDADMDGKPLRVYPEGTRVFYPKGSTHRPLSGHEGADIDYIAFDGIVFGETPSRLLVSMARLPKIADEALEYAFEWMTQSAPESRATVLAVYRHIRSREG